jgi:hypothetical protein
MPNPFNPLDWISSAQDWFTKTERSSGFRPYLIYLILSFGISLCLLTFFGHVQYANETALGIILVSVLAFVIIYSLKSFTEPNFCRSESHIQKVRRIELEAMGNESHQIDGIVLETEPRKIDERRITHDPSNDGGEN